MDAASVAGYRLDGWSPPVLPGPLEEGSWIELLDEVVGQRLTGLLAQMVMDGILPLTEDQKDPLIAAHSSALARDLHVERTAIWAVQKLTQAGLDHRVLKGTAVAHLDYSDPALRSFVDADILVRSDEWDAAVDALAAAGARRIFPAPRPGWERRFAKCATFRTPEGYEIDLHRTFVFGRFGITVHLDDLWETFDTFSVGGQQLKALVPEARWMHTCFGAAVGDVPPRLAPLRDVVQMSAGGRLDVGRLRELTARWEAGAVVQRAVALATQLLQVTLDDGVAGWVESLSPSRSEEAALRAYTNPGDRYIPLEISVFWGIKGLRDKAAYVSALVWPDRSFVEQRYTGRLDRLRSAAVRLRDSAFTNPRSGS